MTESPPDYDCQTCGACCADHDSVGSDAYIFLRGDEARRMRRLGLAVVQVGGESFLASQARAAGGRVCAALEGEVGDYCGCSIYDRRPLICRQFEAGSESCRDARRRAGLPT